MRAIIIILFLGATQFTYSQNEFDDFKNISNESLMDSLRVSVEVMYRGEFCNISKYSEKILGHITNCGNGLNSVMNSFDFNDPNQKEKISLYKDFVRYLSQSYYQSQEIFKNSKAICEEGTSSFDGRDEKIKTNYSLLRDNMAILNESLADIIYFLDNEYEVKYRRLIITASCPNPDIFISYKKELDVKQEWEQVESYYNPMGVRTGGAEVEFKIMKPGYYKIVVEPTGDWSLDLEEGVGLVNIGFEKKNIIRKTIECGVK
ncbi:MAG: hypothetical protein JXQ87_03015 [Bacteroidia bacterium]